MISNVISVLSLFSGGGFLDLGFINNGFQIEEAFEINDEFINGYNFALKTYFDSSDNYYIINNFVEHRQIKNSNDISEKKTQATICKTYKDIEGIIGGPPCQDYSIGGKNLGIDGERGKLIISYFTIIKKIKPNFLLFENVEGLYRTKTHQKSFLMLLNNLRDCGYTIWFDIINPLNYGFPQDRPRIIVVGFKNKIVTKLMKNGYKFEEDNEILKRSDRNDFVFRWPKIKFENPKCIKWPSKWSFGSDIRQDEIKFIPTDYQSIQVINAIGDLENNVPNQKECFTPKSDKFNIIQEGDTNRKSFKRLHRFKYSPTVAYGNNEVHLHPTLPRRLTVREALRLQTIPDNYILPNDLTLTSKFKMISNGVPAAQAELISYEIRRTLINYYKII